MQTGWENGKRVQIEAHPHWQPVTAAAHHDPPRFATGLSDSPDHSTAPDSDAHGEYAAIHNARRDIMAGIGGAGLQPANILHRMIEGAIAWAPDLLSPPRQPIALPLEKILLGGPRALEVAARQIYGPDWRTAHARAGDRLAAVLIRTGHRPERTPSPWRAGADHSDQADQEQSDDIAATRRGLLHWLLQDGAALPAVERWFALAWKCFRDVLGPLSGEDIGAITGWRRATVHEWIVRYIDDPAEWVVGEPITVAGQKPAALRSTYAANAAHHCPRRGLGPAGQSVPATDRAPMRLADLREAKSRARLAAAEAERKRLEADAEAMAEIARRNRERAMLRRRGIR